MPENYKLYKNVTLGPGCQIGNGCQIGLPPVGKQDGELPTLIGDGANLRSNTVIYAGVKIGKGFSTGHGAMIREGNVIGDNVSIGTNAVVERDSSIGSGARIHSNAFIAEYTVLEEGAWVGPGVVTTNAPHPKSPRAKEVMKGPYIQKNAKIGANATLLPFITIGENALVGAGSVVVDDVPRNAVVAGNPARVIKGIYDLVEAGGSGKGAYSEGGVVEMQMEVPRAKPMLGGEERRAVLNVLASGQFINGENVKKFEEEFAAYVGTKHAISLNSGTSALILSLMAYGAAGKEVITVANTFLATANAIELAGAKTVFVDPDPESFCIDPEKIEEKITPNTCAIIPVHLYGQSSDMGRIMEMAKKHNLAVIEDAAQAHGTLYRGKKCGSIGNAGCFSFFPTKNMTVAGDGGMVTTDDDGIAKKLLMLRNNGRFSSLSDAEEFGTNNRLTEIPAAVGRVQLRRVDGWNKRRREIASIYGRELSGLKDITLPKELEYGFHVFHLYTIRAKRRDELAEHLKKCHVGTSINYAIPLHMTAAFRRKYNYSGGEFPVSESLAREIVSLPMFPGLSDAEVAYVCKCIKEFFS